MKLGEIKIETLNLMFAGYDYKLTIESLSQELSENYQTYLNSMTGAINRCLANIESKRILTPKSRVLNISEGTPTGAFIRFDLSELISDYYDISRLVYSNNHGVYDGNATYQKEGDTLVLRNYGEDEQYVVVYYPKAQRVTDSSDNNMEMNIPDNIASVMPYYIKGDLYRDDEPNEASEARNWYEQAISEMVKSDSNKENCVNTVFSMTEL